MDIFGRVRRASHVEGMSVREAARVFGLHRETVSKMLLYSVPPGNRRSEPARRPKLDPFLEMNGESVRLKQSKKPPERYPLDSEGPQAPPTGVTAFAL